MTLHGIELFFGRILAAVLYRVVWTLSGWLREQSPNGWDRLVEKRADRGGARGIPLSIPSVYTPNKRKTTESRAQSGSPDDTPRLI